MPPITTYTQLEDFGRIRLSRNFSCATFCTARLPSGMACAMCPSTLIWRCATRMLCRQLAEPLQTTGASTSALGYRGRGQRPGATATTSTAPATRRIRAPHLDQPDANGLARRHGLHRRALAVDYMQKAAPGQPRLVDSRPPALRQPVLLWPNWAPSSIGWHEAPGAPYRPATPRLLGCLTRPGMANHGGTHASEYPEFPRSWCVPPPETGVSAVNAAPAPACGSCNLHCRPPPSRAVAAPWPPHQRRARPFTPTCLCTQPTHHDHHLPCIQRWPHSLPRHPRKTLWRKAGGHASLDSAIHGANGAAALFRGKVRIDYATHGQPPLRRGLARRAGHGLRHQARRQPAPGHPRARAGAKAANLRGSPGRPARRSWGAVSALMQQIPLQASKEEDMRTTLDISDDVLLAAKELARRGKKAAGQVISELAQKPSRCPMTTARRAGTAKHGQPVGGARHSPPAAVVAWSS